MFVVIGVSVGIDCSVFFSTLYLYLRDVVGTKEPEMWYGAIVGGFYTSSTIFGELFKWSQSGNRTLFVICVNLKLEK